MRIAVLDDYQGVARDLAEWSALPDGSEIQVFRDHLADESEAGWRGCKAFRPSSGCGSAPPFPARCWPACPTWRLLITTRRTQRFL